MIYHFEQRLSDIKACFIDDTQEEEEEREKNYEGNVVIVVKALCIQRRSNSGSSSKHNSGLDYVNPFHHRHSPLLSGWEGGMMMEGG